MKNNPEIIDKVLSLLRQYGWETGSQKLEAKSQAADDADGDEVREFFLGWMAAERGAHKQAVAHFQDMAQVPGLAGWALLAQAFVALREKSFELATRLLRQADELSGDDQILGATIAHLRGTSLYHEGKPDGAYQLLRKALDAFGEDHFGTGRVLDTLGMIYAGRNNFHAAREFFAKAIQCKERHGDEAGLAVSQGQLGRLYLDWGLWEKAEHHFLEDLHLCQQIDDERGQAQMYNFLGQVALGRGDQEAAACQEASAQRHWNTAAGWLDASIAEGQRLDLTVLVAYARKDRGLVYLAEGDLMEAENQLRQAEELFRGRKFEEGLAHVRRAWGMLRRKRGEWDDALAALRAARKHFVKRGEPAEVARTQFEIARVHRASGDPQPLVCQAFLDALNQAEACRRSNLVRQIEEALKVVDPESYHTRVYQRVRGRAVSEDTTSLMTGIREPATVLYLDLKGSTEYARGRDPGEVMLTLNQMMADLVSVLRKHDARISGFRGDGFLALVREEDHALRAVRAGLDLFREIAQFNEPRAILKVPLFTARIGIATGEVFLGNVGTYDKMDFTAIGTTANLGARLQDLAEPGLPCIGRETYEAVRHRFTLKEGSPRTADLKGLGVQEMWDVVGER